MDLKLKQYIMRKLLLLLFFTYVALMPVNAQDKYDKKLNEIMVLFDSIKSNFSESENGSIILRESKVIDLPNINKNRGYIAALELLSNMYKDSKEVIQNKDKENGIIFGKGVFLDERVDKWGVVTELRCEHNIKVEFKDYKCRISIQTDKLDLTIRDGQAGKIYYKATSGLNMLFPFREDCKKKRQELSFSYLLFCYENVINAVSYFEKEIKKIAVPESSDDW